MVSSIKSGQSASQSVATTPLRVFGASGWTGADTLGQGQHRYITLCVSTGASCFFQVVDQVAALAGSVSPTDFLFTLSAGQSITVEVAPTDTIAVVSAGASTVRAKEEIEVQ